MRAPDRLPAVLPMAAAPKRAGDALKCSQLLLMLFKMMLFASESAASNAHRWIGCGEFESVAHRRMGR
eukprot:1384794-Pyramimonas_sp.AAC.2